VPGIVRIVDSTAYRVPRAVSGRDPLPCGHPHRATVLKRFVANVLINSGAQHRLGRICPPAINIAPVADR
jgi:hypothetical protein